MLKSIAHSAPSDLKMVLFSKTYDKINYAQLVLMDILSLNPHMPVAQKLRISAESALIRQKLGSFFI